MDKFAEWIENKPWVIRVVSIVFLVISPVYVPACVLYAEREEIKGFYKDVCKGIRNGKF